MTGVENELGIFGRTHVHYFTLPAKNVPRTMPLEKNVSGPLLGPGGLPNPAEASGFLRRPWVLGCREDSINSLCLQHVRGQMNTQGVPEEVCLGGGR